MENLEIESTRKNVKLLQNISLMMAILITFFFKIKVILFSGIAIGLILQAVIFIMYRRLGESRKYLRNKALSIGVSLIFIALILISGYIWP